MSCWLPHICGRSHRQLSSKHWTLTSCCAYSTSRICDKSLMLYSQVSRKCVTIRNVLKNSQTSSYYLMGCYCSRYFDVKLHSLIDFLSSCMKTHRDCLNCHAVCQNYLSEEKKKCLLGFLTGLSCAS